MNENNAQTHERTHARTNGSSRRLILFTRYPIPGSTKTRLIPALGEKGAADLQREMTEHTLKNLRPLIDEGVNIEVRYEGGDVDRMTDWLGQDMALASQGQGDLGVRMEQSFKEAFADGAGKAVIVGSDCPDLAADDVREAFILLENNLVVLGPAFDGGYYLIGIRSKVSGNLFRTIFSGVPWGSSQVLSRTVNALAEAGIGLGLLDEKGDVDEPEDLVLWERYKSRSRSQSKSADHFSISVILPVLNEGKRIGGLLNSLKEYDLEVNVVDGGSIDETADVCCGAGVAMITSPPGRAAQMNAGAGKASGRILLFLHVDTELPRGFPEMVRGVITKGNVGGAFSFGVDEKTIPMRIVELAANFRSRHLGIVFGDQAIFVRADLFRKIGGFPDLPVMEDYELVRSLRKQGRFVILPRKAVTSARRWRANGVGRMILINQAVTWLYMLGVSADRLARWYKRATKN